jgi:hypothetical protein
MRYFSQQLNYLLSEDNSKTPKAERSPLWRLEQELKRLNAKCCMNSGMGERYEFWRRKRDLILKEILKHRPLNDWEKRCCQIHAPVRDSGL